MEIQIQNNLTNRTSIIAKGVDNETKRTLFMIKIEAKGEEARQIAKQRNYCNEKLIELAQKVQIIIEKDKELKQESKSG